MAQEVIPAAHDWMQLALLESATCFTYGEERRSCRACGVVETAPVAPLAHNFVKDEETQLHTCTLCNGILFAGHLYVVFEDKYHWFDAYELCEEMGGHLATVTSKYEQEVINNLMSSDLRTLEAYWIGGIRLTDGFHWITEEPFEYTNWKSGQPNFNRDNQYFIRVESPLLATVEQPGLWNDDDYQYQYGFVCEFNLDVAECEHIFTDWETTAEPTCWTDGEQYRICTYCGVEETEALAKLEHNFVLNEETGIEMCEQCNAAKYNGNIYVVFTDKCNWFEAYSRCEALGGHLATITSEEEQTFIVSYLKSFNQQWYVWLGGYSDGEKWHWITDELFDYTDWIKGEPSNGHGREWFMDLKYDQDWKWNDASLLAQYVYLCEFECEE
ncbi:MAG: C-type lectin domain-containing protein [Ruminococcaceae bacterium]|nr:C-type lectin domain-containing protein [Oscillospiraceae bacterium]